MSLRASRTCLNCWSTCSSAIRVFVSYLLVKYVAHRRVADGLSGEGASLSLVTSNNSIGRNSSSMFANCARFREETISIDGMGSSVPTKSPSRLGKMNAKHTQVNSSHTKLVMAFATRLEKKQSEKNKDRDMQCKKSDHP